MASADYLTSMFYRLPVWLQNLSISSYGYYLYRKRYAGAFQSLLAEAIENQTKSTSELAAYKDRKFRDLVKHACTTVPYYQTWLDNAGITEHDLDHEFQSIADLTKLPVVEKAEIKAAPQLFISKAKGCRPYFTQTTSGSTGSPLTAYVDETTYKAAMALLAAHEISNGVAFGAVRATFAGRMIKPIDNKAPPYHRYNRAERQYFFSSYHLDIDTIASYVDTLNTIQPAEIIGYPSAIYNLAYLMELRDLRFDFDLKLVVTNSETLLSWQRETIENTLNTPVRDYYGTAEYVVFANQCSARNYHFNPLLGHPEVLDQEQKSVRGEAGDLVVTSLSNRAMPLLRYKVGDTAILAAEACSCGSSMDTMAQVIGRVDDYVVTPDGRKIGRLDHVFKGMKNLREAQIKQHSLSDLEVLLVKTDTLEPLDEVKLQSNIRERLGDQIKVRLSYVDLIERGSNGKFKSVIGIDP